MLLANYHTHTARCRHAWGEDKEYVENAIQEGMKVLGFSDHCPWIFPKDYVSHTRMEPQELDGYFYALEALRQEYARDITIYIGFESEYIPELMEEQNQLLDGYPVDYMILGEHFTASEVTGPYTGFPTESEQDLEKYVDLCIAGMETGKYVYVAHPDLIIILVRMRSTKSTWNGSAGISRARIFLWRSICWAWWKRGTIPRSAF